MIPQVRRWSRGELQDAGGTPGIRRAAAVLGEGFWSGLATTEPQFASGWHHHDDHDTIVYVLSGRLVVEFGPGGGESVEAGPGDFVHVPPRLVHREVTPGTQPSEAVVVRVGSGQPVVNVEGPPPADAGRD